MQADLQKSSLQTERILDNLSNASYFMLLMVYVKKIAHSFQFESLWYDMSLMTKCYVGVLTPR